MAAAGMYLHSTLNVGSSDLEAIMYLVVVGGGLGMVMSNVIVAAQNVASKKEMGVVTSSMSLFRSIGGTLGVTVLGTIVTTRLPQEMTKNVSPEGWGVLAQLGTSDISTIMMAHLRGNITLPAELFYSLQVSLSNSITYMFLIGAVIVLASVIFTALIKSVPLKSAEEYYALDHEPKTAVDVVEAALPETGEPVAGKVK